MVHHPGRPGPVRHQDGRDLLPDVWQRVFTAKTPTVARWGGATAGIYCILYGAAGALIGLGARVALPDIDVQALGKDVVAALTIAYDILVGGLLVAILGGLVWKRGTGVAAAASMAVGSVITLGTMIFREINAEVPLDGIYANEPIYYGLLASAAVYIAVSLLTRPTDPAVMANWHRRVAGAAAEEEQVPALTH